MVRFRDLNKSEIDPNKKTDLKTDKDIPENSLPGFSQLVREKEMPASEPVNSEKEKTIKNIEDLYEQASTYLIQIFEAIKKRKTFDLDTGFQIFREIAETQHLNDALFIMAIHQDNPFKFLVNHCVNVAIYAIRIGENLGFSKERQMEIGMAGLLHEVGMAVIPDKIIYKQENLSQEELLIFKERPTYAYKILQSFEKKYAYLAQSALHVHERIDGSGYPSGLNGDEIHEYAQIIGLVDIYEALSHSRPQREKYLHFYTVKEIIKTGKKCFQQRHIKALLNVFSIFPLGSYVRLNSNAIGKVIEIHPNQPMRPKLRIIYDSQNRIVLIDRFIDLTDNSLLHIVDSVSEKELQELSEVSDNISYPHEIDVKNNNVSHFDDMDKKSDKENNAFKSEENEIHSEPDQKTNLLRTVLILGAAIFIVIGIAWYAGIIGSKALKPDLSNQYIIKKISGKSIPETKDMGIQAPPGKSIPETPDMGIQTSPGKSIPETPDIDIRKEHDAVSREEINKNSVKADKSGESEMITRDVITSYPYSILLSAYRNREDVEKALTIYSKKNISPYWVKVDLGDYGVWFRVFAGHFDSIRQAEIAIEKHHLKGAKVKNTKYAAFIATYSSESELNDGIQSLLKLKYSPYVIQGKNGEFNLYVGAFYTEKGAKDQCLELTSKGIRCRIVER